MILIKTCKYLYLQPITYNNKKITETQYNAGWAKRAEDGHASLCPSYTLNDLFPFTHLKRERALILLLGFPGGKI